MKTMKLHIIRHGIAQGNLTGRFVGGGTDVPLTDEGRQNLAALREAGAYPPVQAVFSSPMQRARQTAEIIYPGAQLRVVEALREMNFGEFDGQKWADMEQNPRYQQWAQEGSTFVPEGGESWDDFDARVAGGLQEVLVQMGKEGISEAACVSHCEVMMSMLLHRAVPAREKRYDWLTHNGSGYTLRTDVAMVMREGPLEVIGVIGEERITAEGEG